LAAEAELAVLQREVAGPALREVGGAVLDRRHEPRASDALTGLRAHLDDQRLVVAVA
jgi:hypothetical protein